MNHIPSDGYNNSKVDYSTDIIGPVDHANIYATNSNKIKTKNDDPVFTYNRKP